MTALYSEWEPFAAQWTRNLIARGAVAPGTVDERSIAELSATDLVDVAQFHAFAGIGIWSYALRRAGVPDDANVWTGSCPCQPFSDAGAKAGFADERHLWPEWYRLIRECRPAIVFGEQVASPLGRKWLDLVCVDLESAGYACGKAVVPAAGVGAPHIRHRIYFVAHTREAGRGERSTAWLHENWKPRNDASRCSAHDGTVGLLGDAGLYRDREHPGELSGNEGQHDLGRAHGHYPSIPAGATRGFWADAHWVWCRDSKWRPVSPQPSSQPMATKSPNRVGRLRAYGNGLTAEVAVAFIEASLEAIRDA